MTAGAWKPALQPALKARQWAPAPPLHNRWWLLVAIIGHAVINLSQNTAAGHGHNAHLPAVLKTAVIKLEPVALLLARKSALKICLYIWVAYHM